MGNQMLLYIYNERMLIMKTWMYNNPDKTLSEVGELPLTFECTDGKSTIKISPIFDPAVDVVLFEVSVDKPYILNMKNPASEKLYTWFPTVEELSNSILFQIIYRFGRTNIPPFIIGAVYTYTLEFINRYSDDLEMLKVPDNAVDRSPKFKVLADTLTVKMVNGDAVVIYKNNDSVLCTYIGSNPSECHTSFFNGSGISALIQTKQFIHSNIFFDLSNDEHSDILKSIVDYLTN